ncbi:tim17-domain-containing protein [Ceraceosorus bombacis]|uniref:Tim17-domain-containing protein n=1 Tax=Ceraceosorus bombacis TaxID=401625 RepID=A0A0P1BDA2_9BASI|nr:tim17-domain-containing protein [Ceraceosorus bombacis]
MVWPFSSTGSSASSSGIRDAQNPSGGAEPVWSASEPSSSSSTGAAYSTPASSQDAPMSSGVSEGTAPEPVRRPTTLLSLTNPAYMSARYQLAGLRSTDPNDPNTQHNIEYLDIADGAPSTLEGGRTALPSRGWSDDLCYGTGTTYLSGLALGGLLGAREGLTRPLGVSNPTFRLRLNAVLNQVTRRGAFFGNSAGVIALIYNISDAIIDKSRGKHDMLGSVAAGGISGALFKVTAGTRAMAISSGLMMGAAATWTAAKAAFL